MKLLRAITSINRDVFVWLTLETRLVASGREYEMDAFAERERKMRRGEERGMSKEPVVMFLGVNRAMT